VATGIGTHPRAIRDWHNTHSPSTVPTGINAVTDLSLSEPDRQVIANSAQPKSYNTDLVNDVRHELTEIQFEAILDKYTVGKFTFTIKYQQAIASQLTAAKAATILSHLIEAHECAIEFKNMNRSP